jgi:hypothetical protein
LAPRRRRSTRVSTKRLAKAKAVRPADGARGLRRDAGSGTRPDKPKVGDRWQETVRWVGSRSFNRQLTHKVDDPVAVVGRNRGAGDCPHPPLSHPKRTGEGENADGTLGRDTGRDGIRARASGGPAARNGPCPTLLLGSGRGHELGRDFCAADWWAGGPKRVWARPTFGIGTGHELDGIGVPARFEAGVASKLGRYTRTWYRESKLTQFHASAYGVKSLVGVSDRQKWAMSSAACSRSGSETISTGLCM